MAVGLIGGNDDRFVLVSERIWERGTSSPSTGLWSWLAESPAPEAAEAERAVRNMDKPSGNEAQLQFQSPQLSQAEVLNLHPPAGIAAAIRAGYANQSSADAPVRLAFIRGYRDGEGNPAWELRFIAAFWGPTEACPNGESAGDVLALSLAGHRGLGQFDPWTWNRVWELAGLSVQEWRSAYWQGYATAVWSDVVEPGSPGGWACFE